MNELESYELSEVDDLASISEEERKKFKVTNLETANWVLRKINCMNKKIEEINSLADDEVTRIETWRNKQISNYQGLKVFFEKLIEEHILEERKKDSKFKLSTPNGSAYVKKLPEKWVYDEDKLIKWLEKNVKDLVDVKKSVKKVELKKYAAVIEDKIIDIHSGEVIEGVTVEEGEEIVVIKI